MKFYKMNFFRDQNKIVKIREIYLLFFILNFLLICISGCNYSFNHKNYNECLHKLEEERQKVRKGDLFTYKAQSYEECRAPARYRMDSD